MSSPKRYRLNPCDYLFYAHHRMLGRSGVEGNRPYMIMELEGLVDPTALAAALNATLKAHPSLNSRIGVSLLSGKPHWQACPVAEAPPLTVHDWRAEADSASRVLEWCERQLSEAWDFSRAPQLRVDLFLGANNASRVCLRWPHAIMDAEGAQLFLSEVNRLATSPASPMPAHILADDMLIDPLRGKTLRERCGLFLRGYKSYQSFGAIPVDKLADGPAASGGWRITHRRWQDDQWRALRQTAERWCPSGPARFSRFLAGCVLRALHRLFSERGIAADAFLVTQPMRVRGVPAQRPVPGNYLVSATLAALSDVVTDKQRLMDELSRQLQSFLAQQNDVANWALVWLASLFREWQYRWYLARPRGLQPYASGFSFYGEIDPPIRSFVGAPVANFYGSGTLAAPPGWNPVFSRFADSLNLALTWREGYFSAATAARYVELIEHEMCE